ncbi:MAG: small, acid-soluble spore protein, alpha/beta type [Turicibacter sp.]
MLTEKYNNKMAMDKLKYEMADELGLPHKQAGAMNGPHADAYLAGSIGGMMTKELVARGEQLLMAQKNSQD